MERQLALEPADEAPHRALMRLYAGLGQPAPLIPVPDWQPGDGPEVQYHAGLADAPFGLGGTKLAVDGVAQGLDGLDVAQVRAGRTVRTLRVPIEAGRFTFVIGPVEDGDQVVMSGPGYRDVLTKNGWWISGGMPQVSRGTAATTTAQGTRGTRSSNTAQGTQGWGATRTPQRKASSF